MINDFFRTAIFKSSHSQFLLLKIRLPSLKEDEYGRELSCAVNSFYRELCKSYMRSAEEAVHSEVEKLIDFYNTPLTFSVGWQSGNESKKRKRQSCESDSCIGFLRAEKLYSREGIIKSRKVFDLFDKNCGFLLK